MQSAQPLNFKPRKTRRTGAYDRGFFSFSLTLVAGPSDNGNRQEIMHGSESWNTVECGRAEGNFCDNGTEEELYSRSLVCCAFLERFTLFQRCHDGDKARDSSSRITWRPTSWLLASRKNCGALENRLNFEHVKRYSPLGSPAKRKEAGSGLFLKNYCRNREYCSVSP